MFKLTERIGGTMIFEFQGSIMIQREDPEI